MESRPLAGPSRVPANPYCDRFAKRSQAAPSIPPVFTPNPAVLAGHTLQAVLFRQVAKCVVDFAVPLQNAIEDAMFRQRSAMVRAWKAAMKTPVGARNLARESLAVSMPSGWARNTPGAN